MNELILGIESTFDDFGVTLIEKSTGEIVFEKNITASSAMIQKYGGVVPKLMNQIHYRTAKFLFLEIEKYLKNISCIGVATHPGVESSIEVGKLLARLLGENLNIRVVPINHLEGHFYANFISQKSIILKKRILFGIFSGGNTKVFLIENGTDFKLLSDSYDDSVGEMLDKISRCFNVKTASELEKISVNGRIIDSIILPKIKIKDKNNFYNTSFSGLKTYIKNNINVWFEKYSKCDVSFTLQNQIFNYLIATLNNIKNTYKIDTLYVGGGVVCNNILRKKLEENNILFPLKKYCIDNSTMIAQTTFIKYYFKQLIVEE